MPVLKEAMSPGLRGKSSPVALLRRDSEAQAVTRGVSARTAAQALGSQRALSSRP